MDEQAWDKISGDYYSEVLSPLKDCKNNPFLDGLKALDSKNLSVIELGCGLGELVPFLEENFKEITAIDFSPEMINQAIEKNKGGKTKFAVADMSDMSLYHGKFDVAVAVNSFLSTDILKLNKMIKESFNVLKPGGKLFVIIPSIESYIYQSMLFVDANLNKEIPQEKVIVQASKLLDHKSYDMFQGIIDFDEGERQKAFYYFEISYRFGKVGFTNFNIEKVLYKWTKWKEAGHRYFPKEDPPWDWYFVCEKPQ